MKNLTIIVPCYNEELNVKPFYDEVTKYLTNENYNFSILFVNDGSKDNTIKEVKKLREIDKRVKFINFSRNFGKEAAMYAGMEACKDEDAIIMIDADLQHPPHLIPEMIKNYEDGNKIVYTRQRTRKGDSKVRAFFAKTFYKIFNKYSDCRIEGSTKDYQLLDKMVVNAFLKLPDNNRFVKGIFSWVGYTKKCIEFDFVEREIGTTKWSFRSLFKYGVNGLNQFSNILIVMPILSGVFSFMWLAASVVLFILEIFSLETFLVSMMITSLFIVMSMLFYFGFYILYQIRRQVLNRPIYLAEETSEDVRIN